MTQPLTSSLNPFSSNHSKLSPPAPNATSTTTSNQQHLNRNNCSS
ncbi:hypothetical protein DDB_G0271416 [Dictyostelium discoideum AX4]|nr:hypothetical protein DDB_G0294186 [Dictyostelium discoideum AX4]XP_645742.1 hypothetical protein DDB_G0271416 [Dictyostelium discoideum AX4]EAL60392.1 hypothetical protein DDB_G0294186 [Dictyostelium discoideum AX4]EAL71838.1 hypothetical protein DDB_G0271416 [Dictyostelium discoideum AX4]|eukprot:XP_628805.1 hypothetical protein DDB_G0294186 [Dictyostelium discoideum AX4]